ncbi:hypothetical protein B0H12DRAFT_1228944 [Mycena haematopus]|nr:hypothetical protein B0H12DRAFT_1228944 [Mycena haematopus]
MSDSDDSDGSYSSVSSFWQDFADLGKGHKRADHRGLPFPGPFAPGVVFVSQNVYESWSDEDELDVHVRAASVSLVIIHSTEYTQTSDADAQSISDVSCSNGSPQRAAQDEYLAPFHTAADSLHEFEAGLLLETFRSNATRAREDEASPSPYLRLEAAPTASAQNKKAKVSSRPRQKKARVVRPSVPPQSEDSTVLESQTQASTPAPMNAPTHSASTSSSSGAPSHVQGSAPAPSIRMLRRSPRGDTSNRLSDQEPTLATFLKTIPHVDLTPYHPLLEAQGLTVPRLHAIALWTPAEIYDGLKRLLMGSESALGHPGMPALVFVAFESAVRNLRGKAKPPRARSLLVTDALTMLDFTKNVMMLDLSPHAALLDAQGFSLPALNAMLSWDPAQVRKALRFTLLDPARIEEKERDKSHVPGSGLKGMSAVEVLAMEFCLSRTVEEGRKGST